MNRRLDDFFHGLLGWMLQAEEKREACPSKPKREAHQLLFEAVRRLDGCERFTETAGAAASLNMWCEEVARIAKQKK